MRRNLLGLIALAMLGFAAVVHCYQSLASYEPAGNMLLRVGIVLAAFWLAWPDLHRMPRWFWYALPIVLVMLFYARGALLYALPLLAAALAIYLVFRKLRKTP